MFCKMNHEILTERCQELYLNILTAVEKNDKLRTFSVDFSAILERSISDFEKSLLNTIQRDSTMEVESECGNIVINSLTGHFDKASTENQIIAIENLATIPLVKHEASNFDPQNDFIELINDSTSSECLGLTFEMDIQEEVVVTTTKIDESLVSNIVDRIASVKRKAKVKDGMHSHMKRRQTMDESDLRTATDDSVFKQPAVKLTKNRHSNLRKTIASRAELNEIVNVSAQERIISEPKNNSIEMYAQNNLYRTLCVLCNRNERYLVAHYVKQHPKNEVLIARPSPKMAKKIRFHNELFEMQNRKIKGMCFFCEEKKNMSKYNWATHILSHTGESIYFCSTCNVSMKNKRDHKTCNIEPTNIYDANTTDGSLNAFMCTACNYLQISRERIVRHLIQEHGYHEVEESIQFEKVVLVPDLSPIDSNVPVEYGFSVRFKCTICSEHSESVEEFEAHFNQAHRQVEEYDCLCGEKITIFDGLNHTENMNGNIISTHLAQHNADLYSCVVCNDLFLTRHNIQNHLLNEHTDQPFKYQHIHREPNEKVAIDETTITKIKCHICGEELQDGHFAQAITHFSRKHNEEIVQIEGFISRKIVQQHKTEMKYFSYIITF